MTELLEQLVGAGRGMWRFRWYGLAVAWVVAAAAVVVVMRLPDRYEASARVYVNTESILRPLMSGLAVQPNVEQQVAMLSRTLISRPNVEKLIRMADLDLKSATPAQQDALVEQLTKSLQIVGLGRNNFYQLSYMDSDAQKAQRVIQSLVSIFVESSLGDSRKDSDAAKVFLDEQIKSYRAKLEEAETRLKEFRLRNIDLQADGKDSAARLGDLGIKLEQARLELREAENARDAARAQLSAGNGKGTDSTLQSVMQESALAVSTPEIDARLEAVRRQLDVLQQRFTEQHPEVQAAKRLVKDLEEQKRREVAEQRRLAAIAPTTGALGAGATLAQQEMTRMLAGAEVQVASLRARVAEYSARLANAREQLKTAPQIEAEAVQLNRDYAIHKKNYEDLVSRRESATMSGQLENAGVADFRLIDPPRVPAQPSWPNRLLLLPLALLGALAAGLVTAFVASQLRPVFSQGSELRAKLGLPVLGVVSLVMTDAQTRRERVDRLRFVAASGSLVGVFMVGVAVMAVLGKR